MMIKKNAFFMPIMCLNMNTQKIISNAISERTADFDVYEYRTITWSREFLNFK